MPFSIPSLLDLVNRATLAFRAQLPGADATLWPNNIRPTAKVVAGMTFEVFGFADYIARQRFVLTADSENLDLHGAQYGLARRAANPARGIVDFVATGPLTVDAGAIIERPNGVQYRVVSAGTLLGPGTLSREVVAVTGGKATILVAGATLTAISGVTGTATITVAADGVTGGTDLEDDETYRARLLFRIRNIPQGGSAADYVTWASQIPGVTRVFVERIWNGAGTVRVFPVFDDDYPGGIAPPSRIDEVADHIAALAPAGAAVQISAPDAATISVDIQNLSPNTVAVQEAVRAELAAAFRRLGRVAGNDTTVSAMPYLATPLSFSRSWLWQAAANAAGEEAHTIASPAADIVIPAGAIPVLGTVTFS